MADIPTANITEKTFDVTGSVKRYSAKVQGDGAGVTIPIPIKRATLILTGNIDDTSAIPGASVSSGILTYVAAPTSGKYHWLLVEGY